MNTNLPLGPLMVDVEGLSLNDDDIRRLSHPLVGGVILFSRNYENPGQLRQLVSQIKSLRTPQLLLAVDHEGGRVQRFIDGFSRLPPVSQFGEDWDSNKQTAPMKAFNSAYQMASDLIAVGIDFSFAPVLDVCAHGDADSEVLQSRTFHANVDHAIELQAAYIDGMHQAGMVAIGKHFPGHGGIRGDSHHCLPEDKRALPAIMEHDLKPYFALVDELQGIMTAHVLFIRCDDQISTFSEYWIKQVLRKQIGFHGIVFSDDLSMQGAVQADQTASISETVGNALNAGCDMALLCNRPDLVDQVLAEFNYQASPRLSGRLMQLYARTF